MAWPTTAVATGDIMTAQQLNGLPILIADQLVPIAASSLTFSAIPQHFSTLILDIYARSSAAVVAEFGFVTVNGDTTGPYDIQYLYGNAGTATAVEGLSSAVGAAMASVPGASAGALLYSASQIVFPNTPRTTGETVMIGRSARKSNTSSGGLIRLEMRGFYRPTDAVTSLRFVCSTGNIVAQSYFALWGLP